MRSLRLGSDGGGTANPIRIQNTINTTIYKEDIYIGGRRVGGDFHVDLPKSCKSGRQTRVKDVARRHESRIDKHLGRIGRSENALGRLGHPAACR